MPAVRWLNDGTSHRLGAPRPCCPIPPAAHAAMWLCSPRATGPSRDVAHSRLCWIQLAVLGVTQVDHMHQPPGVCRAGGQEPVGRRIRPPAGMLCHTARSCPLPPLAPTPQHSVHPPIWMLRGVWGSRSLTIPRFILHINFLLLACSRPQHSTAWHEQHSTVKTQQAHPLSHAVGSRAVAVCQSAPVSHA